MGENYFQGIAIIGLAGRFPDAETMDEFWENLKAGVESIKLFSEEELAASGIDSAVLQLPNYIRARAPLKDAELFDAAFFGITPREAEIMDPQHRIFLETSWHALENAGYDSESYKGLIGVFAGMSNNTYFSSNLASNPELLQLVGPEQVMIGNEKDYLATRVSYKLNLKGPSVNVYTACSTSLVAVCHAVHSLLNYQCDMALAGGVSIKFPQKRGYLYQEGSLFSADGHTRTFDANARGTAFGHGAGVVVLKRLENAIADGDTIYAVIKGAALNNDGSLKVSFHAPSVEGQAECIAMAQAFAEVDARSITFVEAHGTATPLGDPIEVAALSQAFRASTSDKQFCAIGSVKTNIGHLDAAAGIAGLIKTTLALKHKTLVPSLNFTEPNPKLDLPNTPFYVNTKLTEWNTDQLPRRAGVSSFGVGGTNAHVILEEAPAQEPAGPSRSLQLLVLSAKTKSALDQATRNLAAYLKKNSEVNLADVAYTLQVGRRSFPFRRILVCRGAHDALEAFENQDSKRLITQFQEYRDHPGVFMFPGQGVQQVNMARDLYESEPFFRETVDFCCNILQPLLKLDLRQILYPSQDKMEDAKRQLTQTWITQPALFVIEYSLASLWMKWGIEPESMIGHSVGEYVAACLAGVFSLEDALTILASRARLMQDLPPGSMLAVRLSEKEVRPSMVDKLSVAAINGTMLCVVSGDIEPIKALQSDFQGRGIVTRLLHTSHAFHSEMMDPVLEPFAEIVSKISLHPPKLPYISNLSGTWITDSEATSPQYWSRHLRETVRFAEGLRTLYEDSRRIFLEVGPGVTLTTLARQHPAKSNDHVILSTFDLSQHGDSDLASVLHTVGRLWQSGATISWQGFHEGERRRRIPLPLYPLERKRYFVEPQLVNKNTQISHLDASLNVYNLVSDQGTIVSATEDHMGGKGFMREPTTTVITHTSRLDQITGMLKVFLEELSGIRFEGVGDSATFMELGLDSLFLTQASQSLQKKFGLKVTFRQLQEDLISVEALAKYIDQKLPPEALTGPPKTGKQSETPLAPVQAQSSIAPVQELSSNLVERVVQEQLQIMAQQLEMLRQLQSGSAPAPNVTGVAAPAQAPAVAQPVSTKEEQKSHGPFRPMDKSSAGALTPAQQEYLNDFIQRYGSRTAESKRLTQAYRNVFADPRAVAGFRSIWKEITYPIVAARSAGSKIWDVDGNEYVDLTLGFGINLFGHSPAFVIEAVEEQLRSGIEIGPQSPLAGEVAQLMRELTGMDRVTFCNTGSEAVMAAMRITRTVSGRDKIALFAGSYHGMFDEVLVRPSAQSRAGAIAPGIPQESLQNIIVLEYGDPRSLEILKTRANEIAAVLVEPVQSRRPDFQPVQFLRELRTLTTETGIALVFDEIVSGFRVHPGGTQALFGIKADLATYGKVVGGGLPIGILTGSSSYMDALDGGMWRYGDSSFPETGVTFFAGTFVRHPLVLAAARAVLTHLKLGGPELQKQLNDRTTLFVRDLNNMFKDLQLPFKIPHFSSFFFINFPPEQKYASLLFHHLRNKGVHLWEGRCGFLSTAHSEEDIQHAKEAFRQSVVEMKNAGFFGGPHVPLGPSGAPLPHKTDENIPLTEAQKEVWLATQMGEDASCSFNESLALHLKGKLQLDPLVQSLQEIIERHEALRTTFSSDGTFQQVSPSLKIDTPLIDLSDLSADERQKRLREIYKGETAEPFHLLKGPLLHAKIVRAQPDHHILILTAHHIVCDGWSFGVILIELSKLYTAKCQGRFPDLVPPMQFREYVESQSNQEPEVTNESVTYWLQQYKEPVASLDLPPDRPRPTLRTYHASQERLTVDAQLWSQLKRLSAQQSCTLFTTLLSAFIAFVSRISGQEDVVVGIPAAGQVTTENKFLIGHCVNLLPIRARVDGEKKFSEFLKATRRLVMDAYDHQNFTFGTLVQKLNVPREPGRIPLVTTTFNVDKVAVGLEFEKLEFEVETNPKTAVNFETKFNLVEREDRLLVECDYNTELYDSKTIQRWLGHFDTFLHGIVSGPDDIITRLPLLSKKESMDMLKDVRSVSPKEKTIKLSTVDLEKETSLENWSRVERLEVQHCIHRLFEEQVRKTPGATALVFEDQRITYEELNKRSNQVAHLLTKYGVGPKTLVGIRVDRSIEMIVGIIAILKAGGAYLPIDLSLPSERVSFMLQDGDVQVLLTQRKLLEQLDQTRCRTLCLDSDQELIRRESQENLMIEVQPESLSYVIYTSGSTGKPKGVLISHANVVRLFKSMEQWFGFNASDVWTLFHSYAFDFSVWEIWGALLYGGRLVVVPYLTSRSPDSFYSLLVKERVTVLNQTPSAFQYLIDAQEKAERTHKLSLRYVIFGGEALETRKLKRWFDRNGDQKPQLINMYGITETTVHVTYKALKASDIGTSTGSLIGVPIPDLQVYILDPYQQLVPVGVLGEIYVGGAGVARGYLNRPELNSERFIPNPFSKDPHSRLYKSGDRARYLGNGELEFFGRLDFQVKIRGYRIELGEIESLLLQNPQIKTCVVVASGQQSETRLIAYVVPKSAQPELHSQLRSYLKERLPDYMIPSVFMVLETLPLTRNGKVDLRSLPSPSDQNKLALHDDFEAPHDALELQLTKMWEKLLNVHPIGIHDNFFEIGGHSLSAVRLFAQIEKVFGKSLSLAILFQAPTVNELAKVLRSEGLSSSWSSLVPIQMSGSKPPFFAIHAGGGHVLFYRDMARLLGPDQPFYALQAQGIDRNLARHTTVEEMATHYINEIRSIQPEGPYYIGGASFGGLVGFEMANQLHAVGQRVGVLALFDTHAPGYPKFLPTTKKMHSRIDGIARRVEHHATNLMLLEPKEKLSYFLSKSRKARKMFKKNVKRVLKQFVRRIYLLLGQNLPKPLRETQDAIERANDSYVPKVYPGHLTLFRASKQPYGIYVDLTLGWSGFVGGGIEIYEISGYHGGIISEPKVRVTVERLKACLERDYAAQPPNREAVSRLVPVLLT